MISFHFEYQIYFILCILPDMWRKYILPGTSNSPINASLSSTLRPVGLQIIFLKFHMKPEKIQHRASRDSLTIWPRRTPAVQSK